MSRLYLSASWHCSWIFLYYFFFFCNLQCTLFVIQPIGCHTNKIIIISKGNRSESKPALLTVQQNRIFKTKTLKYANHVIEKTLLCSTLWIKFASVSQKIGYFYVNRTVSTHSQSLQTKPASPWLSTPAQELWAHSRQRPIVTFNFA